MKYEVIIFDADETLFDFKMSEKEAFKQAMLDFNFEYDEQYHLEIYHNINTMIWKEFEEGLITQEKLKVERFKRLSTQLGIQFDENKFAKAYIHHLANASFIYDNSIDLLEKLYNKYKLIIITNGLKDVQDIRIRKSTIAHYFEDIVVSEEVGAAKPDPIIFEFALKQLDYTDKSKVLMVGDSLSSDIKGGINFGIDTCWYNPTKQNNKSILKPTYEISDLHELIDVLEQD